MQFYFVFLQFYFGAFDGMVVLLFSFSDSKNTLRRIGKQSCPRSYLLGRRQVTLRKFGYLCKVEHEGVYG